MSIAPSDVFFNRTTSANSNEIKKPSTNTNNTAASVFTSERSPSPIQSIISKQGLNYATLSPNVLSKIKAETKSSNSDSPLLFEVPVSDNIPIYVCKSCQRPVIQSAATQHLENCGKELPATSPPPPVLTTTTPSSSQTQSKSKASKTVPTPTSQLTDQSKSNASPKQLPNITIVLPNPAANNITSATTGTSNNSAEMSTIDSPIDNSMQLDSKKNKKRKTQSEAIAEKSNKKEKKGPKTKEPFDLDTKCGVRDDSKGEVCTRSITCKIHPVSAKRLVQGRSQPYDILVQVHQAKQQRAKAAAAATSYGGDTSSTVTTATTVTTSTAATTSAAAAVANNATTGVATTSAGANSATNTIPTITIPIVSPTLQSAQPNSATTTTSTINIKTSNATTSSKQSNSKQTGESLINELLRTTEDESEVFLEASRQSEPTPLIHKPSHDDQYWFAPFRSRGAMFEILKAQRNSMVGNATSELGSPATIVLKQPPVGHVPPNANQSS